LNAGAAVENAPAWRSVVLSTPRNTVMARRSERSVW
jgi:hypothetical protein